MTKILITCAAFRNPMMHVRWRLLAEAFDDIDVTLVAPKRWIEPAGWWGTRKVTMTEPVSEKRFRVVPVSMWRHPRIPGGCFSPQLPGIIRRWKPDFAYLIGSEGDYLTMEAVATRKIFNQKYKIGAFTMRGLPVPPRKGFWGWRWRFLCRNMDAVFCHYPDGRDVIRKAGYTGPLYMQTQVGVDCQEYRRNETWRKEVRAKLGVEDEFVFGTASRINRSKGLFDAVKACEGLGDSFRLVILGSGPDETELKQFILDRKLAGKVILTGRIPQTEIKKYYNAFDCLVHVPHKTPQWIETFSLVLVQAMATGLPIIGSRTGSVPYQLGSDAVLVEDGDVGGLRQAMVDALNDPDTLGAIGQRLAIRARECFDIRHLNELFYHTFHNVINGRHDPQHEEQCSFRG